MRRSLELYRFGLHVALGLLLIAILCSASPLRHCARAAGFSFTPLGDLPGGIFQSKANAISADGSVVVGYGVSNLGFEAFRWTASGGMVGLGATGSEAHGVSADGSVVVGIRNYFGTQAFRWTAEGGLVGLGFLSGEGYSQAYGVSADGSVVVGVSGGEGFRWTAGSGMIGLGDLPGGGFSSTAHSVSADGSVVVGGSNSELSGPNNLEAFRWTAGGGMLGLGDLPGGSPDSFARAVSADGSVVVGNSSGVGGGAFRWTADGGMVGLGRLPGAVFDSTASDVSADGSIVVGWSDSAVGYKAFLWSESTGMLSLQDYLLSKGVLGVAGWQLSYANGVSGDGRTIVGYGTNPLGQTEAWIATLAVPEPATCGLALCAALCLMPFVRRHGRK